jgi:SAM-dependent methyltransferase
LGAARYIDVDLSETMLDLARQRLERFGDRVELVQRDFLTTPIEGQFQLVLALGYFDYVQNALGHLRRIAELLAPRGSVVASFPRWTWTRGPIRKVRYEMIDDCPIFNYTKDGLQRMFADAGLSELELHRGKSGFLAQAISPRSSPTATEVLRAS